MPAPKTIVHPEYQIDLDRLPAQPAGCAGGMILVVLGLIMAAAAGGLLLASTSRNPTPPPLPAGLPMMERAERATDTTTPTDSGVTPTMTLTLDAWSITGTALVFATASPTTDYCFWLTATSTPPPTPDAGIDDWSATGTAIYAATNPYLTPTPTPDVPRAWCNHPPTFTATSTPLTVGMLNATVAATSKPTLTPTRQSATGGNNSGGDTCAGCYVPPAPPAPPDGPPPGYVVMPTVDLLPLPTALSMPTGTPTMTLTPTITRTPNPLRKHGRWTVSPTMTPTFTPTVTPSTTSQVP